MKVGTDPTSPGSSTRSLLDKLIRIIT